MKLLYGRFVSSISLIKQFIYGHTVHTASTIKLVCLLNAVSYLHTLTCFELRPPWRFLFHRVQDRPHKTSVPPHPDTSQLDTIRTFPDPRRSKSQHCSLLTDKSGRIKTDKDGMIKGYYCNYLYVYLHAGLTHTCTPDSREHFNLTL